MQTCLVKHWLYCPSSPVFVRPLHCLTSVLLTSVSICSPCPHLLVASCLFAGIMTYITGFPGDTGSTPCDLYNVSVSREPMSSIGIFRILSFRSMWKTCKTLRRRTKYSHRHDTLPSYLENIH